VKVRVNIPLALTDVTGIVRARQLLDAGPHFTGPTHGELTALLVQAHDTFADVVLERDHYEAIRRDDRAQHDHRCQEL
jgi:alpha-glucuronidase